MNKIVIFLLLIFVVSCGKDDQAPATATTPTAVTDINYARGTVENLALFTDSSSFSRRFLAPNTDWDTNATWGTKSIYDTTGECVNDDTPQAYMDNALYSGCASSNFWDLMGLFRLSCAAMYNVTSSNGIPAATALKDVTLSASIKSNCDIPAAYSDALKVAVDPTTTTTVYQRKVTIYVNSTPAYVYWIGKDGTKTNMQFQDLGMAGAKFVGFYTTNSSTNVTLFELQGRKDGPATAFFLRFHQNSSTNVATALGTMGDIGATNFQRWSFQGFAGDPTASTSPISVNMQWDNGGTTGTLSTCIDPQTKTASGTTIACGTYAAPAAIATVNTFLDTTTTTLRGLTDVALLAKTTETSTVNFTPSDIHSAAIQ